MEVTSYVVCRTSNYELGPTSEMTSCVSWLTTHASDLFMARSSSKLFAPCRSKMREWWLSKAARFITARAKSDSCLIASRVGLIFATLQGSMKPAFRGFGDYMLSSDNTCLVSRTPSVYCCPPDLILPLITWADIRSTTPQTLPDHLPSPVFHMHDLLCLAQDESRRGTDWYPKTSLPQIVRCSSFPERPPTRGKPARSVND